MTSSSTKPRATNANKSDRVDSSYESYVIDFQLRAPLSADTGSDNYISNVSGSIICLDGDKGTQAGRLSAHLIHWNNIINDRRDIIEICDEHSRTVLECALELVNKKSGELKASVSKQLGDVMSGNILVLDRIEVLPEHRGRGLGLAAACSFLDRFGDATGIAILKPFPLQLEKGHPEDHIWRPRLKLEKFDGDPKHSLAKVRAHWQKLGFKRLKNSDYLALSLTYARRGLQELLPAD